MQNFMGILNFLRYIFYIYVIVYLNINRNISSAMPAIMPIFSGIFMYFR